MPEVLSDGGPILPLRPCVGIMVLNGAGLVLVCQRKDQSGDTWQMPQGGIDNGESPRAAALRELEEEIGTADVEIIGEIQGWIDYDLPADLVGRVWKGQYRGQTQKWFAVRLLADEGTINLGDDRHAEFDTWRWIEPERLPEVIVPFKRGVYEAVVKEFQPLTERLRISG